MQRGLGQSADVGWKDGKPRPLSEETGAAANLRVEEDVIGGRRPRPRSNAAPKPASTVNYSKVVRAANDAIDLPAQDFPIEGLLLKNAEAIKQFEYLDKSLQTFQDKVGYQTASLRQPVPLIEKKMVSDGILQEQMQDNFPLKAPGQFGKDPGVGAVSLYVGASPVYIDVNFGHSNAMVPLSVIYTEGDNSEYDDMHLKHVQPVLVEGEGYLYGIKSVQKVAIKESVRGHDFVAVFSGANHSLAITAGGQVFSWGANDMRQLGYPGAEDGILGLDMVPQLVDKHLHGEIVITAACGKKHSIVITEDGKVFSWGAYFSGQLGQGEISKESYPYGYKEEPALITALDTRAPRMVACGDAHSVLIDGLGDLWSFGSIEKQANGHGGKYDVLTPKLICNPREVVGLDFRQVACGAFHTIALTASGMLWAWGWNEQGQLGLGDITNREYPTPLANFSARNIRKVACGETHTVLLSDRDVYTFGNGEAGALGHGNAKCQRFPKPVLKVTEQCRIRDVEAGPQFTLAISDLGQMYFWGNMKSTSGRGAKHVYNTPMRFKGLEAIYGVAAGWHEVTALVRIPVPPPLDHTFKAGIFQDDNRANIIDGCISRACTWGKASGGKLGHGVGRLSNNDLKTPFAIYGNLHDYSVIAVCCGETFSLCITDNGRLFAWGENKEGQLGVGDFKGRAHPTLLEHFCDPDQPRLKDMKNKVFENIAVGNWHCLAVTNKKKVYSWGKNKYGQLGLGHTNHMCVPHCVLALCDPLNPKHVRSIACGKSHSVAAGEDGDVFAWGRGWDGQLGHKVVSEVVYEPRIVEDMENKSTAVLACGREHTVAVSTNGNLWVWGDNKAGQLGLGNIVSTCKPVPVSSLDELEVKMAACGREHTVVVTATNEVYGFGSSIYDQLGLGHLGIFPRPQRIPGLTAIPAIRQIACGHYSTALVGGDENAYLLGRWDGLTTGSYVPSITSKYSTVRKSIKGINADLLSLPLGIQAVRAITLGLHHGMIIGTEEDKQGLIQQRIEREAQAELASKQTFQEMTNATKAGAKGRKGHQEREPVQPWIAYQHGGEPFPEEVKEATATRGTEHYPPIKQAKSLHIHDDGSTDMETASRSQSQAVGDDGGDDGDDGDDSRSVGSRGGRSDAGSSTYAASQADARSFRASEGRSQAAGTRGYIVAWGNNQHYQLGCAAEPSVTDYLDSARKPLAVPSNQVACPPTVLKSDVMHSVTTVSCGEYHTIAVCQDGSLWTWGRNNMGQLGHGDTSEHKYRLPTQVMGLAKKICIRAAAGGQHSLVLTSSNKVYAWGCNLHGQLGLSKTTRCVPSPDIVPTLRRSGSCHIACGYSHCVALLSSEQIFTWGRNDCGQLGLGHYKYVNVPEHVTFFSKFRVQQVGCGYDHCIAFVKETESLGNSDLLRELVYTWGRGEEGQLGHSDQLSRCVPKEVGTLTARGILVVTAGGFSSVAIDEADQVYTWGDSGSGQLGHGDKVRRLAPTIMMEPLIENQPKPDIRNTFRARAIVCGPHYMLALAQVQSGGPGGGPGGPGGGGGGGGKSGGGGAADGEDKLAWGNNLQGQLGMPYCNMKKRKGESQKMKLAPERVPFLSRYPFKEVSCGLEHVLAVVDLEPPAAPGAGTGAGGGGKRGGGRDGDGGRGGGALTVDQLEEDLRKLYVGEVEEDSDKRRGRGGAGDDDDDGGGGGAVGDAAGGELAEDDEGEDGEDGEDEDEDREKLHYPRQIYDRVHSVKPLVVRLGLSEEIASVFEKHGIRMDSFITLDDKDLEAIGVGTVGARRRIRRAIEQLRNAVMIEEEEAESFVPPEYTQEQHEGHHPLAGPFGDPNRFGGGGGGGGAMVPYGEEEDGEEDGGGGMGGWGVGGGGGGGQVPPPPPPARGREEYAGFGRAGGREWEVDEGDEDRAAAQPAAPSVWNIWNFGQSR